MFNVAPPAFAVLQALSRNFRVLLCAGLALAVTLVLPAKSAGPEGQSPAAASTVETENLVKELARKRAEVLNHLQSKRYIEAIPIAEATLSLSEVIHGNDANEAATAAHNLGFALRRAGRDADALIHLERAKDRYDRSRPAVHEDMRNVAGELGQIYLKSGRAADVIALYEGLIARARTEGYEAHVGTGHLHNNLAFVLRGQQRRPDARAHWLQAIAIYARDLGPDDDAFYAAINALQLEYRGASEHELAKTLIVDAIDQLTQKGKDQSIAGARLSLRLSEIAHGAGDYKQSKARAEHALTILNGKPDANASDVVSALNNLARAEKALANYSAAEQAYKQAIARLEQQGDELNIAVATDNLAVLYGEMRRVEEAELYHKRALQTLEKSLGREHRIVGETLGNLGALLYNAARYPEAELLLKRALQVIEGQNPQDPASIAIVSDNLSGLCRMTARPELALQHLRHALELFEKALSAGHPSIGVVRNNLGRFLLDIGNTAEAEPQLLRALKISEANFGPGHTGNAVVLNNLGELYLTTKRYALSRDTLKRSIELLERPFGAEHPNLVLPLVRLGRTELADGHASEAEVAFQRAVAIEITQNARGADARSQDQQKALTEQQAFEGLIEARWPQNAPPDPSVAAETLETGEWMTMTSASRALASLGARAGAGDPDLASLVRERQDLGSEWGARDRKLTESLSQSGPKNTEVENALRERLDIIGARMKVIDAGMQTKFPLYGELARPTPVAATEVQRLLLPNEAALQFAVTPEATHLWLITATEVRWVRLPIRESELKGRVVALRCGLDRSEWEGEGAARCAKLLGREPRDAPDGAEPLPFDLERAHSLYQILLGPIADAIAGKDLLIVPTGPLTALPFHVLVSAKPAKSASLAIEYAKASWLSRQHAVTIIPSLASLRSIRQFAKLSQAGNPFIGFGNPLLTGREDTDRRAWAKQSCAVVPVTQKPKPPVVAALGSLAKLWRGGLGDVDQLRRQQPLPETADELCLVAQTLQAGAGSVFLGENATEQKIKALSDDGTLAKARVLHFATHGLLAGETAFFSSARTEPSLILSPPGVASELDDGLLTASEIANLKLDADWVVLSACNTAGGSGGEAEALSGLARAFFYAGARALLVSHWAVDSAATVRLVTMTFAQMKQTPGLGRAQAVRRSMVAMIDQGGHEAHPAYWAPFIVVGEGGGTVAALAAAPPLAGTKAKGAPASPATAKKTTPNRAASKPAPPAKTNDWSTSVFAR